jgi:hypothetical protein
MSVIRVAVETGARTYHWGGRELPSVTTILQLVGLPERHVLTLSRVVDRAIEQAQATADRLRGVSQADHEVIVNQIRADLLQAASDGCDQSAALGTAIHAAIASGGSSEELRLDVLSRVRQYDDWLRVSGANVLASEFEVWNLTQGYAGTADLLVRLRNESHWLVDIETGRSVHPQHALQLAAYGMAEFVGADGEVDDRLTELLRRTRNLAVLHLTADRWEFRSIPFSDDVRDAFSGLLRYVTWNGVAADEAQRLGARRSGAAPEASTGRLGQIVGRPAIAIEVRQSEPRGLPQVSPIWQCAVCGSRDVIVDPMTPIDARITTGRCRAEGRNVGGVMTFPVRPLITAEYAPNAQRQIEVAKAARQRVADGRGKGSRRKSPDELVAARHAVQARWDQEAEARRKADR